jgi:prepilin-type N-terminal cleavage/methylation domain-containing protein
MSNDELIPEYRKESETRGRNFGIRSLVIPSSFVPALRDHSSFRATRAAFTLMELLIVIAIIAVLAGLIFATAGYVQKNGKRSRAEAEIAALTAALENYKADNGAYPSDAITNSFDVTTANVADYEAPGLKLYDYLSGDSDHDRIPEAKSYFPFKPNQLSPVEQTRPVTSIRDPFGNPFGYSTMKASNPALNGHNPTFDLWSLGEGTAGTNETKWIKNW